MICVLLYLCAVATLTQHPHWFRVPAERLDQASDDLTLPRATVWRQEKHVESDDGTAARAGTARRVAHLMPEKPTGAQANRRPQDSRQPIAPRAAAARARVQSPGKDLAVHATELAVEPNLQIL
jgi:hypothetical protein